MKDKGLVGRSQGVYREVVVDVNIDEEITPEKSYIKWIYDIFTIKCRSGIIRSCDKFLYLKVKSIFM